MAKNNLQDLSQIDYCLQQYYSKYMASTLLQERKKILQEQKDAASKLNESLQRLPNFGAASNPFTKMNTAEQLTKKSLDDLAARTSTRWFKDPKVVNDYSVFVTAFYERLVAKNGGKASKALEAYANNYCANRLQKLMIEQLARENIPSGTAAYIAKKAFSESILGMGNFSSLKKGSLGEQVDAYAEKIYNPSIVSKAVGKLGGYAIDAAVTPGGVGKGASSVAKTAVKFGTTSAKWLAFDGIINGGIYAYGKIWGNEDEEKKDNRIILGDEDASLKIQDGARKYKKNGTDLMQAVNAGLTRKIKLPPPSTSSIVKKESNTLLTEHKGNSYKLLTTIKGNFSKQCVPINENSKVPGWMLNNTAKQNRALAASFYACGMEMSREQKQVRMFGGKKMTLKEVSQRAYDYARAALAVDKHQAQISKRAVFSSSSIQDINKYDTEMQRLNATIASSPPNKKQRAATAASVTTTSPYKQGSNPYTQQTQQVQPQTSATANQSQETAGWGTALDGLGLNGMGDIGKNLGYVLAMLPDMIIGMFTGKTPNLKLQDNLMPLAAIVGGMFVKSPLLKLLLIGFGGANILNKAGHAAINDGLANNNSVVKTYKIYPDEPLNHRIENPAMKGSSMVATIDGVPSVINISSDAADAYTKGAIPINTLANAVLRKYDENKALAAQNYEQHMSQEETTTQSMGIK